MGYEKKKVVVIGGGTGLPVLLKGLKKYPIDLTALVTVADDGGSTGVLREKYNIPAPGDIRNVITALSEADEEMLKLFQHRFQTSNELSGHALGNIVLAVLTEVKDGFYEAIQELSKVLEVKGKIYPVTNESISLITEMEDGTIINGESNIPLAKKKIKRLFLGPEVVTPIPEVIDAIIEADFIVISPGSLYTSIMPNLIIPEINQAFKRSKAHFIYVCNIMTQDGETTDYRASDHVKAIHDHIGEKILDTIIVNNGKIDDKIKACYERENARQVENDLEQLKALGLKIIEEDIVDVSLGAIRHNTFKVSQIIFQLMSP